MCLAVVECDQQRNKSTYPAAFSFEKLKKLAKNNQSARTDPSGINTFSSLVYVYNINLEYFVFVYYPTK